MKFEEKKLTLLNDYDGLRNQLKLAGLTYPGDSVDPRYKAAMDYLKVHNIPVNVEENCDFSSLALGTNKLSSLAQCRVDNASLDKVEDFTSRFSAGEKLVNPIIAILHEGCIHPVFGNQRSKALKASGVKSSVMLVGDGYSSEDKNILAMELSAISNRVTTLDVDTDSRTDMLYQMRNFWDRVLLADLDSHDPLSLRYREMRTTYCDFSDKSEAQAAEDFKRECLVGWFDEFKPATLSSVPTTKKHQFGQYYNDAFSEDIKQKRQRGFYTSDRLEETYSSFWSEMYEVDGEEVDRYGWDPNSNSYAKDATTVQMVLAGQKNPLQNGQRAMLDHWYSGKKCQSVELVMRPPQAMKSIRSIRDWQEKAVQKFTDFNNNPKIQHGIPQIDKLVILQHTTDDSHQTIAYEWKRASGKGFFKSVHK